MLDRSDCSNDLAAVRVGSLRQPVALAQAVVDDGHLFFQGDRRVFLGALQWLRQKREMKGECEV